MAILLLLIALILPGRPLLAEEDGAYRLAIGDRISVRVLSWNTLTLEFDTYDALAGTFGVDGGGRLALPLLPPVEAAGRNPQDLSEELSELYRGRLGLSEPPSITVDILQFGPIFVIGDVSRPGKYDYTPGLTAIQAFALAGGVYRLADTQPDRASSVIRSTGTLKEIGDDLARARMTMARLQAEGNDEASFDQPELPAHPKGAEAQQALYHNERSLFESRRERLDRALASIDKSRALLKTEIPVLDEKLDGIKRQLALIRESVGNMETLRERGLARSPSLVALQRTQIEIEARELDTETGIFRARHQLSELDRDESDLRTGRRLQVLQDLQKIEGEIEQLETRGATTRRLIAGADALLLESKQDEEIRTEVDFAILRDDGSSQARLPAKNSTVLNSRDVLVVTIVTGSE